VASAQVGQPEVKLGLIPGAGGTQRLPRLAGVAKGVEMCWSGDPVPAAVARDAGIVDRIIEGDLLAGAIAFAREIAASAHPKTRDRNEKLDGFEPTVFDDARAAARKRYRGWEAPLAAIDAVEAATKLSFDDGIRYEAELFARCLFSDQSRALIHVFFGERAVSKIPGIGKDTPKLPIARSAVVGAGTMGRGIAMSYANAGIPVLLQEASPEALETGLAAIHATYESSAKKGRITADEAARRFNNIKPITGYQGVELADIVVEAVFENLELKKRVFAEIDAVARPGAILASNTSTLSIDEIASATRRPEFVIGHHFFSPAHIMRLLEVVRGKATSSEVIATSMDLARKLKKIGVLAGNCRGFIGNRMFGPYRREAVFLAEEGNPPAAIDRALVDFGMAMGPLAVGDLAGLDVGWRIRQEFKHTEVPGWRYPDVEDRLCETGQFGQKTGAGWYRYDDPRHPVVNPDALRIVGEYAAESKTPQREASLEEIVERTIYALINEGAHLLGEGMALRAADIDIVYLNGYGFPAWRGGPMWHASTVGLNHVLDRVRQFRNELGPHWEPAPLLEQLASEGRTFDQYDQSQ